MILDTSGYLRRSREDHPSGLVDFSIIFALLFRLSSVKFRLCSKHDYANPGLVLGLIAGQLRYFQICFHHHRLELFFFLTNSFTSNKEHSYDFASNLLVKGFSLGVMKTSVIIRSWNSRNRLSKSGPRIFERRCLKFDVLVTRARERLK